MRQVINLSESKENKNNLFLKLLRELYVQNEYEFDNVYTFRSKSQFPVSGDSKSIYIDRSDNMAVYIYDGEYIPLSNRIDEIIGN